MKFELTDENLLKVSCFGVGLHAAGFGLAPDDAHDLMYNSTAGRSPTVMRWFGHALAINGMQGWAVAVGDSRQVKKDILRVHGFAWATASAKTLYDTYVDKTTNETPAVAMALGAAVMGALCLSRGYQKDDEL